MWQQVYQILGVVIVIFMDMVQKIIHPLLEVHVCRLAASHQGVDNGSIFGSVSGKPGKKRVRIFDSFTHAAFRKHSKISILQPLFKFKYQRIGLTDTFFLTLFNCESGFTGIRLYLVQPTDVVNRLCANVLFSSRVSTYFLLTCAQQPTRVIPFICSNCS